MPPISKADAQKRADQIGSFRAELEIIENEKIAVLDDGQREAVTNYHESLLAQLSSTFDVDASVREKRLSLGMKIASFLGALGLAASVFFLFYQFWGRLPTYLQVLVLLAAPILGVAARIARPERRERRSPPGMGSALFTSTIGVR